MSTFCLALLVLTIASTAIATGKHPTAAGMFNGLSKAAMLSAAKTAPLRLIDEGETYCDGDTPIAEWLARLTATQAMSIAWTAGPCNLRNDLNPLDDGGDYCVDAEIRLKHPKDREDTPVVEIYLDDPKHGQPGPAYAFRDVFDSVDGEDYERDRRAFEDQWRERFKDAPASPCQDE